MGKVIVYEYRAEGIKKTIKNQNDLTKAIKDTNQSVQNSDFGTKKYEALTKQQAELKNAQQKVREEAKVQQRELVIAADKGRRSARALGAELKNLEVQYDLLSQAERKTARGRDLAKKIVNLRTEIRGIKADIGKTGLSGALTDAFKQLGGVALFTGGVTAAALSVKNFISDSISTFADFNRQISFLGAISGASAEDLEKLRAKAQELGATTQFTASQVAQLEIEYAKLGFTPAEILETTADTLNLATVAQSELGETAAVVGSVLRAYNLDVSQTGRVTDVAAKAFSSSALDLQKFQVAMSAVAPVAANANVSLEDTVALLGILVDRGLDASTAGTGLRNVFLDIAAKGLTLEEAFKQINTATDANVAALELFGKRGATIGAILAKNTEASAALSQTLNDAGGFAAQAAEGIQNDLKGAFDTFNSALEAVKINLVDLFATGLKSLVQTATAILSTIAQFLIILKELPKFLRENKVEIIALAAAILSLNAAAISANATLLLTSARTVALTAATKGLAIAQRILNTAMRLNPIGLVVTAIAGLVIAFEQARKRSERFRATLSGLGAFAKELFTLIGEGLSNFSKGFDQIKEGNIGGALLSFGKGIQTFNPIAVGISEGGRLAQAFNKGYVDGLDSDEIAESTQDVAGDAAKLLEEAQIRNANALNKTNLEIQEANDNLKENKKRTDEAAVATDAFATGSIAALRKELRDLKTDLDNAAPSDQESILSKLLNAEQALDDAEKLQQDLRKKLFFGDPIPDLELLPVKRILALRSETAQKEIQINREKNAQIIADEKQRSKELEEIQTTIFSVIRDSINALAQAGQARLQSETNAVEERYDAEIAAAEGNTDRQTELENEKAQEVEKLRAKEFERQKAFQTALALTSLAQGIVSIIAAPTVIPDPFGSVFKGLQIGVLTATTAAQIAAIQSQQAARGLIIKAITGDIMTPNVPLMNAKGNLVKGRFRGDTHQNKSKGIGISVAGIPLIVEHGEMMDTDEAGNVAIINKRSAAKFHKKLDQVRGLSFPGKRQYLSDINSYRSYGVKFAQQGAILKPDVVSVTRSPTGLQLGSNNSITAKVDDESANMVANKTAIAVRRAVKEGLAEGLDDANRRSEREKQLKDRTGLN